MRITAWPKPDQYSAVSWPTSPVTQVAEVAVNSAGRSPQDTPSRDAAGRVSSSAPRRMIAANISATICVVAMCLGRCFIQKTTSFPRRDIFALLSGIIRFLYYSNFTFFCKSQFIPAAAK